MTKLIPRNVSFSHNSGRLFTDLVCEELITVADISYEVTCPSEPENEPDQPQEELPQEDPFPDIGASDVLTRNSFRSGNLFESIDDPIAVKSIAGMSSHPTVEVLNDGADISSNVVSSNNYIYWVDGLVAFRKSIKSGGSDKSFALTDYTNDYFGTTLVEEGVLARLALHTTDSKFYLIKSDFETETETVLASVEREVVDEYLYTTTSGDVYTIVGSDNKIYIIFHLFKYLTPAIGDWGYSDIHFYIYNYTDGILYNPVVLDIWDRAGVLDITTIWQYEAPAIVQSEIVFTLYISWAGGFTDTDQGIPFYCVNVETQTGQAAYQHSYSYNGSTYYPGYQYRMVSDRMYRRIYCIADSYTVPYVAANTDFAIFRYDLAANSIDIESHHLRKNASQSNYPYLIQDKEYAYKLTNLLCADKSGTRDLSGCSFYYPLFSRIENYLDTVLFDPPSLDYWPYLEYDIDDVTGAIYSIDNDIPIIWVNRYERSINISSAVGVNGLYLQGDHILLEDSSKKLWVVYD